MSREQHGGSWKLVQVMPSGPPHRRGTCVCSGAQNHPLYKDGAVEGRAGERSGALVYCAKYYFCFAFRIVQLIIIQPLILEAVGAVSSDHNYVA